MRSVLTLRDSSTTLLIRSGRLSNPIVPSIARSNLDANSHLVADRRERFADKVLACVGAVDFGGVEERDAAFMGGTNDVDALGPVCGRAVVGADAHAPGAKFRGLPGSRVCGSSLCFSPC